MTYTRFLILEWRGKPKGWCVASADGTCSPGPYRTRDKAERVIEEYASDNAAAWKASGQTEAFCRMQYENAKRAHAVIQCSFPEDLDP